MSTGPRCGSCYRPCKVWGFGISIRSRAISCAKTGRRWSDSVFVGPRTTRILLAEKGLLMQGWTAVLWVIRQCLRGLVLTIVGFGMSIGAWFENGDYQWWTR